MLMVNILGLGLIALIIWWFWLYRGETTQNLAGELVVTVDNGVYEPAQIAITAGQPQTITFLRKDASPCAETVVFPGLDLSESLPLNQPVNITLPALAAGEYPFHCQMQMYKGLLKASNA